MHFNTDQEYSLLTGASKTMVSLIGVSFTTEGYGVSLKVKAKPIDVSILNGGVSPR